MGGSGPRLRIVAALVLALSLTLGALAAQARVITPQIVSYRKAEKSIPDGSGSAKVVFDLRQGSSNVIADLNASVRVSHRRTHDLKLRLEGPGDLRVPLSARSTHGAHLGTGSCPPQEDPNPKPVWTTFDEDVATPIDEGTAPYAGSFNPVGDLHAVDGQDVASRWELVVKDVKEGRRGVLKCAQLTMAIEQ